MAGRFKSTAAIAYKDIQKPNCSDISLNNLAICSVFPIFAWIATDRRPILTIWSTTSRADFSFLSNSQLHQLPVVQSKGQLPCQCPCQILLPGPNG